MISPVKPASRIKLSKIDSDQSEIVPGGKEESVRELQELQEKLADLQERFYVSRAHKLLIVLQGMDTSGKNGTIRDVFRAVNPQGVNVASFKKPTADELSHDFLWRIHRCAPGDGEIVIFDRSHYEDIMAVRVHELKPPSVWKKRFDHIRDFEKMLVDEGTIILKFLLHIDAATQRERLESRLREPAKRWKFDASDIEARRHWDDYLKAYDDVLNRTSTADAPWYIIPSNRKWLRNLLVARVIVDQLQRLKLEFPKIDLDPASVSLD
ncbi:MAG TPA: PPK2 family polyphosphate kinase [Opitutaceae bacterium]